MTNTEDINSTPERKSVLQRIGLKKEDLAFTAKRAWIESTYGEGQYKPIAERVKDKQCELTNLIKARFGSTTCSGAYYCVVEIEQDLIEHSDKILEPFIEGGFNVVNLSKECDKIKSKGTFFIEWCNAFEN